MTVNQFRIIIVGAGIAGLTAAVGLRRKGHHVTVLERFAELRDIGGRILVSPNALRVMGHFGLYDELEKVAALPIHHTTYRYDTGEVLDSISFEGTKSTFGYDMLGLSRTNIQRILYDAAVDLGVDVRLSSIIESFDESSASIMLASGEKLDADLIVGGDGIRSAVRSVVIGRDVEPIPESLAFQTFVPGELVRNNPITASSMDKDTVNTWFAPGRNIVGGSDGHNDLFTITLTVMNAAEKDETILPSKESFADSLSRGNKAAMTAYLQDFEPRLKSFIDMVDPNDVSLWRIAYLPDLDTWVSPSGKVTLLGDAAHAMVPHIAQGASTAIEDGGCLAECIGYASSVDGIPGVLHAYERIRKPRTERIKAIALQTGLYKALPNGTEQRHRDQKMKEAMDPSVAKFELLKAAGGMDWVFNYDFVEACKQEFDISTASDAKAIL